jgi:hypothetical protein
MTPEQKTEFITKLHAAAQAAGAGQYEVAALHVQQVAAALDGVLVELPHPELAKQERLARDTTTGDLRDANDVSEFMGTVPFLLHEIDRLRRAVPLSLSRALEAGEPSTLPIWEALNKAKSYFAELTPGYAHYEPLANISLALAGYDVAARYTGPNQEARQRWVKPADKLPALMVEVRIGYTGAGLEGKMLEMKAVWDGKDWYSAEGGINVLSLTNYYQVLYWLDTPPIKAAPKLESMPFYERAAAS